MDAPRDRFLALLTESVRTGTLIKLTLGKHRGADPSLRNLLVRPVTLQAGPRLGLVWRHETRDVTKNHEPAAALVILAPLIGKDFRDAHLFTSSRTAQLQCGGKRDQLRITDAVAAKPAPETEHDRRKPLLIPPGTPWLKDLGVTNDQGRPREGQAPKFRQINRFAELLLHLLPEAFPSFAPTGTADPDCAPPPPDKPAGSPLRIADMGCGKGYLTFGVAALLGQRARVTGVEARPELVAECNRTAATHGLANLSFAAGRIATEIENQKSRIENSLDVLIALHACDTATDDAIAQGITAGAGLILLSPCCQKELRPQLTAPPVLAPALRHGIFQERQAEFVTDALRALLLEWAGYQTKVFEFISTEHTAKNLMIAAIRSHDRQPAESSAAGRIRDFAAFYGIRRQRLADHLGFSLTRTPAA